MSPPRILALHGPARDDLHRSVLRELAEVTAHLGAIDHKIGIYLDHLARSGVVADHGDDRERASA